TFLTPEEYLAIERKAETRSEYFEGKMSPMTGERKPKDMFAMTGASKRHNLIAGNIFASLHRQLQNRDCEVYQSEMRVRIPAAGLYTYPDVIALCGESKFEDDYFDTLLNPTLIVEVLSPSTEAYDRGKKFKHYQQIGSLVEYLLVAQDSYMIEQYVRQSGSQWLYTEIHQLEDIVNLTSIGCELTLREVYAKVL
ncbi:MAG: Uma2 family endonuclease, partial [Pyrinomonadaceae bacterium]